jgi:hypothetical protein
MDMVIFYKVVNVPVLKAYREQIALQRLRAAKTPPAKKPPNTL